MRSLTNFRWDGCNKSSLMIGPFKRVGIAQSMPTLSTNPNDLKQAVSLAVPAKISNAKTWLICCPSRDQPLVKLWLPQRWSWSEWGLKHPGSAHKWIPLVQLSPAFALLHPFGRLYAQQSRCFWGVSRASLMRPAGILGPRLLPARPFCPPFPFTGCCLRGLLDLFLGFDALAAGAAFGAVPDSGSRWKATFGWLRMVGSVKSKGNWLMAFLSKDVILSDRSMNATLSARKICCTDTAEYPGRGDVCKWSSKSAWYAAMTSYVHTPTRSNAKALRFNAFDTSSSVTVGHVRSDCFSLTTSCDWSIDIFFAGLLLQKFMAETSRAPSRGGNSSRAWWVWCRMTNGYTLLRLWRAHLWASASAVQFWHLSLHLQRWCLRRLSCWLWLLLHRTRESGTQKSISLGMLYFLGSMVWDAARAATVHLLASGRDGRLQMPALLTMWFHLSL